ncbi:TPA: N-acetylmannosamine-6-phosphate 2-epimerase [Candidatus Gastranaerophilales bacterium HUM_6]|nr:N-acetylmannosamine-6-phosphate 2-epimerase [bacterium]DAA89897.1 MAG TPA: N-acetylmannosamine-6-phosphate 2-epimerase [Candidatus Gastranaerophilales bacterium HUM_7]DAA93453.1 MAG TPA: N-acetylmannosamine-6-phosphate 2-epimerase [Candidatus Gastranaerophilales bacterium HUM_6]DAB03288.1 MAG TPA: N-acetylmannosamine-6-phosphate 2-epimerase [Candidatus Gastranaerophilales bacterium HUM_12]DAB05439.1 MAG TPA: N-acetylmannosamine-6-phosphate 2-epimerase [Candidatus Gastranaerophilales bacteriu
MLNRIKGTVVVSVQAMPNEPLYLEQCMIGMMKSVVNGGAGALRLAGARDVKNAKKLFNLPIIGLTKPNIIPKNYKELVYITPNIKDVIELVEAGADVIATDATQRKRPNNEKLQDLIKYIHINKRLAMADISTLEEGLNAKELGADIISTTLAGYTLESANSPANEPDFELLKQLVEQTQLPVVLEGRIWEPEQVNKAFELGAHCVVIGSAITRPQLITKRFVFRKK